MPGKQRVLLLAGYLRRTWPNQCMSMRAKRKGVCRDNLLKDLEVRIRDFLSLLTEAIILSDGDCNGLTQSKELCLCQLPHNCPRSVRTYCCCDDEAVVER